MTGRRRNAAVRRAKDHGADEATASALARTTLPPFEWFETEAAGCLEALYGRAGLEAIWNPAEPPAAGSVVGGGSKAALAPKLKRLPSIADSSAAAVAAVARVAHGERAGTAPPPKEHTGTKPKKALTDEERKARRAARRQQQQQQPEHMNGAAAEPALFIAAAPESTEAAATAAEPMDATAAALAAAEQAMQELAARQAARRQREAERNARAAAAGLLPSASGELEGSETPSRRARRRATEDIA